MEDSFIELVSPNFMRKAISCSHFDLFHKVNCKCLNGKMHEKCSLLCISLSPDSCTRAHLWCHIANIPSISYIEHYNSLSAISEDSFQINLDISRTFPENSYFINETGSIILAKVLNKLSNFMPDLGYVQGMNYICGALLWHTSEIKAFWLMVSLMNEYKLRENFSEGLPGLLMHCNTIEKYIKQIWPKLHNHFEKYNIFAGMFMTDWCITIFTNVIPIDKLGKFFTNFFVYGWEFFYKLALEILERLHKKILKLNDRLNILSTLKPFQLLSTHQEMFIESIALKSEKKNWNKILSAAKKRKLIALD